MKKGLLQIIATPIGNLQDISLRAIEAMKSSDLILCENPKHSRRLLDTHLITVRTAPLFSSVREEGFEWIMDILREGGVVSYISDAGTPGISDPGSRLVRRVREDGIQITPIPGPSALSAMLSISGCQVNPCIFLGFLSEKKGKKQRELEQFKEIECVLVFYESVHRIRASLQLVREIYPNDEIMIGRELTKSFEEIILWKPGELLPNFIEKGEFVVLINNRSKKMTKAISDSSDVFV